MPRVKRGILHLKKRRALLRATKGYLWGRKSKMKRAHEAFLKAGQHAFMDRRKKKRNFRQLWNIRINAGARQHGMSYSRLIADLKRRNIQLDRKILAQLAAEYPKVFEQVVRG
ncbi:50S ribosomal protein L20 [Candidatus Uhrbacteria bacterium]|nr:50S ribosomal protein L20 [Candidatus Uhrbacteria bacterium]